jgi:hypothetical protein
MVSLEPSGSGDAEYVFEIFYVLLAFVCTVLNIFMHIFQMFLFAGQFGIQQDSMQLTIPRIVYRSFQYIFHIFHSGPGGLEI